MDLPEEDKAAIAKRRAIQALMRNTSLTPAERHARMQDIMKGNFPQPDDDDDDDDGSDSGDDSDSKSESEGSYSGSDASSKSSRSSYSKSSRGSGSVSSSSQSESSAEGTKHDDDASISLSGVESESGSESHSSSQYSGSQITGSVKTEDDSQATGSVSRQSSRASSKSKRSTGGTQKQQQQQPSTKPPYNRKSSLDSSNRSLSSINTTEQKVQAGAMKKGMAQKDKQKALLEISRDKSLSAKERQAKMKEIMATPVQGTANRAAERFARSESNVSGDTDEGDDKLGEMNNGPSPPSSRRPSRQKQVMKDSIRECTVDESKGIQPMRTSVRMGRRRTVERTEMEDVVKRIKDNDVTLTKVEFQKMNLTDEDVIPLLDQLGKNTTVTTLDLRRNRIGTEGSSTLASAILDNKTLTTIDISGNNLGDEGLEDLSKVIPYNKTLTTLNIEDNKIGDVGATSFAKALIDNKSLTSINLSGNVIGDVGAIDLFKVLSSQNSTITKIMLRFNAISDKGATELASTLLDNETLTCVDLGHNKITNRGGTDLLKVVSINDTLGELELGGNVGIDEKMLDEIKETLEESDSDESDSGSDASSKSSRSSRSASSNSHASASSEDSVSVASEKSNDSSSSAASEGGDDDGALTGGEAMLQDMPDENNAALAKRKAVQSVMQDKSLSGVERNKKIQDIMAGKVELPKVEPKRKEVNNKSKPKQPTPPASESESEPESSSSESEDEEEKKDEGTSELTGGEAMLEDMPDETNTAMAKRKAIQSVMQDTSLSGVERNKKIQDIMAGKVELPTVNTKKAPVSKSKPQESDSESDDGSVSGSESESGSESGSESSSGSEYSEGSNSSHSSRSESSRSVASDEDSVDTTGGEEQLTGGEAMLEDMPDETNTALAKRKAIQSVMQDKTLSGVERNQKMQDIMAGKVDLPKVQPKKVESKKSVPPPARKDDSESESDSESEHSSGSESGSESSHSEASDEDSVDTTGNSAGGKVQLTGGEAMLEDMPDENDTALAKRKAIQSVMQDKSLSGAERNKKMQDILAGRVELPKVEKKAEPKKADKVESKTEQPRDSKQKKEVVAAKSTNRREQPSEQRLSKHNRAQSDGSEIAFKRLPSNDGGMRSNIAHEWKARMMTVHPRSHDNMLDLLLAHQYRLSLKAPPCQSYFRVVAVVFFSRVVNGQLREERYHVVGTNDEPHSIGGSICAERAALMQLRFIPDLEEITKIVIVTDHVDAISPGLLCREFMASHNKIPWNVPIVLGRSVCRKCGFIVSGKACSDINGYFEEEGNEILQNVNRNIFGTCSKGHDESKKKQYDTPHDFVGTVTTLQDLFPYPSLYTRLSANEALKFGEEYMDRGTSSSKSPLEGVSVSPGPVNGSLKKQKKAEANGALGSYRQESFNLGMLTEIMEESEDGSEGGSQGSLKSSSTSQKTNGSSFTSSFASKKGGQMKSSMTHSLKTTIDFMRQVREDTELESSLTNLTDFSGSLEHLTARTLRMSSRLKTSQRREKLMRLATEVTAMEIDKKHAHPMRYGAAVLFSDDTIAIASQKVALEYGCTLDAVGQLASTIDRKALQVSEDSPSVRPILLVMCDHFGIAHPPFAQGRAFLTEHGYGGCKVLFHQQPKKKKNQDADDDDEDIMNVSVGDGSSLNMTNVKLRLLEVEANDLAPAPPDMFGGAITKSHDNKKSMTGGLQIQF